MRQSDAVSFRRGLLGIALLFAGPLSAQSPTSADPLPRLTIRRGEGLVGLLRESDVRVAVDRDAYVAVFAVTPGSKIAPIQVLAPSDPQEQTPLRGGKSYVIRPLSGRGLMHLANAGSPPVLVAFVSLVRPNLAAFREGTRWSTELVVADSTLRETPAVVRAIAKELYGDLPYREVFGTDVPYRVVTERATEAVHLSSTASAGLETDCLSRFATLSYTQAITQASNSGDQRPLPTGAGTCSGISVDWPIESTKVYPAIGAPSTPTSSASSTSPVTSVPAARVPQ